MRDDKRAPGHREPKTLQIPSCAPHTFGLGAQQCAIRLSRGIQVLCRNENLFNARAPAQPFTRGFNAQFARCIVLNQKWQKSRACSAERRDAERYALSIRTDARTVLRLTHDQSPRTEV